MNLQLKDKVALITGSSKGIGLRTALAFAREGGHVAICARGRDDLNEAAKEIRTLGVRVAAVQGDVSKASDCLRIMRRCVAEFGGLDILVNNAYSLRRGGVLEGTDDDWRADYEGNVVAAARMIRLAIPHMRKRPGAAVVNIASISGWHPQLTSSVLSYGSAKAALIFNTEGLALELVRYGIRVNTVSPGAIIWTDNAWDNFRKKHRRSFAKYVRDGFPMGRLGKPEEVADVIVFVASPRAHWINGRHIPVDGLEQPVTVDMFRPY
jgi:3-oxoacyl-[acyl-carrier protein] reductase